MSNLRTLLILLAAMLLTGCLEGGIGGSGTGGRTPGPPDGDDDSSATSEVQVTGFATKGPFAEGATVHADSISATSAHSVTQTAISLGRFALIVAYNTPYLVEASGRYFSEGTGVDSEGAVTLKGVMFSGASDSRFNVNVATHITHMRIQNLIDEGLSAQAATDMAEAELLLALSDLIPAPANPIRFGELTVLNGFQQEDNQEGNAWLLALSSLIERAAIAASDDSGELPAVEVAALCDALAGEFAGEGMLSLELVQPLVAARDLLDPDRVHRYLFEFSRDHLAQRSVVDDAATIQSLQGQIDDGSREYHCEVFGDEVLCAATQMFPHGSRHQVMDQLGMMSGTSHEMFMLEAYVANMNRFVDSDGDGIVNTDDDDDDNDGVADSEDETPYGS